MTLDAPPGIIPEALYTFRLTGRNMTVVVGLASRGSFPVLMPLCRLVFYRFNNPVEVSRFARRAVCIFGGVGTLHGWGNMCRVTDFGSRIVPS